MGVWRGPRPLEESNLPGTNRHTKVNSIRERQEDKMPRTQNSLLGSFLMVAVGRVSEPASVVNSDLVALLGLVRAIALLEDDLGPA